METLENWPNKVRKEPAVMKDSDELLVAATLSHLRQHSQSFSRESTPPKVSELDESTEVGVQECSSSFNSSEDETCADIEVKEVAETSLVAQTTATADSPNVSVSRNTEEIPSKPAEPSKNVIMPPQIPDPVSSESPKLHSTLEKADQAASPPNQKQWKNVLLTATSMVLTQDARRKVRQVLAILRLASEHLNAKVNALQVEMEEDADLDNVTPKISRVAIRNDIINTIKKCVAMFSTLATNSLPSVARARVRNTILKLPTRWANQLENSRGGFDKKSESAVLALATETLVAIQNITNILSENMDRADSWVEKLPKFSLGKKRRLEDAQADQEDEMPVEGKGMTRKRFLKAVNAVRNRAITDRASADAEEDQVGDLKDSLV